MKKVIVSLKQKYLKQELRRKPEMDMVMYDKDQDEQYTKDGEEGSLAILYDLIINGVSSYAPEKGQALDICCGSGQLLCKLAKQLPGINFTGLDLSPNMIEFAKKSRKNYEVKNVDFTIGSMYDLDKIFEQKFDLITWFLALHHCECTQDVISVFNQIAQLIEEDGTIFIFDIIRPKTGKIALQYADVFNSQQGDWYYQDSLDSYKAAFTFQEMADMLKKSDLKNYLHIEPILSNFHQAIIISKHKNKKFKKARNLKKLSQKIDYYFLRKFYSKL